MAVGSQSMVRAEQLSLLTDNIHSAAKRCVALFIPITAGTPYSIATIEPWGRALGLFCHPGAAFGRPLTTLRERSTSSSFNDRGVRSCVDSTARWIDNGSVPCAVRTGGTTQTPDLPDHRQGSQVNKQYTFRWRRGMRQLLPNVRTTLPTELLRDRSVATA